MIYFNALTVGKTTHCAALEVLRVDVCTVSKAEG